MVERIAQGMRDCLGPHTELFERIRVTGAVALIDTVGPHRAPFVMVALEPDLEQILKLSVVGDIVRRQVAVVVEDWFGFRKGVIQPPGSLVG